MYLHQMCDNCVGQGTVADRQTLETKTCGVCEGIGQVWEDQSEVRVGHFDHWPIVFDPRWRRDLAFAVTGVVCGMAGTALMNLLMEVV